MGIRENERRAAYLGYNVNAYKIFNTAVSGFFTSVAGVLALLKNGIIGAEQMDVIHSGEIVIWSVVGGLGALVGPFVGARLPAFAEQGNFGRARIVRLPSCKRGREREAGKTPRAGVSGAGESIQNQK